MAAFLVDAAITACGITIDNALAERVNKGTPKEPKWEAKYTLHQILDPLFRLPAPLPPPKLQAPPLTNGGLAAILAMAGQPNSGVKLYKYVPPEATLPN